MATVACVGIAVMDFLFEVDTMPHGEGKFYARSFREIGGGVAANAAWAVARLGGASRYIGRVGDDRVGALIIDGLAAGGVDTSGVVTLAHTPSPVSAVLVDGAGDRIIINHTSPELFAGGDVSPARRLDGVDALLIDVRWPAGAAAALDAATERGIPSIFDFDRPMADGGGSLLTRSSHIAFSAAALEATAGVRDPEAGLLEIATRTEAWVAVTLGGDGAMWLEEGSVRHQPAFAVEVVDTVGAGDVFHGALALGIGEGMDEAAAVRFASAAAALKCTRPGARASAPTRDEVDDLLRSVN